MLMSAEAAVAAAEPSTKCKTAVHQMLVAVHPLKCKTVAHQMAMDLLRMSEVASRLSQLDLVQTAPAAASLVTLKTDAGILIPNSRTKRRISKASLSLIKPIPQKEFARIQTSALPDLTIMFLLQRLSKTSQIVGEVVSVDGGEVEVELEPERQMKEQAEVRTHLSEIFR